MEIAAVIFSAIAALVSAAALIVFSLARKDSADSLAESERRLTDNQARLQQSIERFLQAGAQAQAQSLSNYIQQNEQKLENIRLSTDRRLLVMQEDTSKKLDEMRTMVEDKLQKTLDERVSKSFALVNERLEQVYKGLGEMRSLAGGVGDLKRVLSGVKTRGVLGEIQLGAILEQLLSPEQYSSNVKTRPNSQQLVEFAVKMPGDGEETVWLPIDSKFPYDRYHALCDAYDSGDTAAIEACAKELLSAIRQSAKEIHEKYIEPPYTTEFGILFLPFEGLYAEAVRRGMVELLQRDYKINITGPTTMGAFLNSLQIGFRTLAVQRRSGEVWTMLGQVKSEFVKFSDVLDKTQKRLEQAGNDLEALVGTRTKSILRSLRQVEILPEEREKDLPPADLQ